MVPRCYLEDSGILNDISQGTHNVVISATYQVYFMQSHLVLWDGNYYPYFIERETGKLSLWPASHSS